MRSRSQSLGSQIDGEATCRCKSFLAKPGLQARDMLMDADFCRMFGCEYRARRSLRLACLYRGDGSSQSVGSGLASRSPCSRAFVRHSGWGLQKPSAWCMSPEGQKKHTMPTKQQSTVVCSEETEAACLVHHSCSHAQRNCNDSAADPADMPASPGLRVDSPFRMRCFRLG